mmetsp:Transcript_24719/g.38492  ORF Transcript_24719/g.38492 Transcript_24719/m.38492 type:complete len:92 (+) Transcript_24719:2118-2393(+)
MIEDHGETEMAICPTDGAGLQQSVLKEFSKFSDSKKKTPQVGNYFFDSSSIKDNSNTVKIIKTNTVTPIERGQHNPTPPTCKPILIKSDSI